MDREAWLAAIHGVARSWTQLSNWTELNWTLKYLGPGKWRVNDGLEVESEWWFMLVLCHLFQGYHKISFLRLFSCFRLHPQPGRTVTLMNDFLYQTRHLISCLEKLGLASKLSLEAKKENKNPGTHQIKAILNSDCNMLEKPACIDLCSLTWWCYIVSPFSNNQINISRCVNLGLKINSAIQLKICLFTQK